MTTVGGKNFLFYLRNFRALFYHFQSLRVLTYSDKPQEQRYDPMVYVFPRVTKCIFHKYGKTNLFDKDGVEID